MKPERKLTLSLFQRCIAVLLSVWCMTAVHAADVNEYLVVHLTDGQQVSYILADKPVVTYNGTQLHVESPSISDDHNLAEVEKFTFEKKETTVVAAPVASGEIRIIIAPGSVALQGLPVGTTVTIADLQGRVLASTVADGNGGVSIATGHYPAGVYIVTADCGRTFKIFKN